MKHEFAADARWKLYRSGEVYDVVADPLEQNPLRSDSLKPEDATAVAKLQTALDRFRDARPVHLRDLPNIKRKPPKRRPRLVEVN